MRSIPVLDQNEFRLLSIELEMWHTKSTHRLYHEVVKTYLNKTYNIDTGEIEVRDRRLKVNEDEYKNSIKTVMPVILKHGYWNYYEYERDLIFYLTTAKYE